MEKQICSKCKKKYLLAEKYFQVNKRYKKGFTRQCKECRNKVVNLRNQIVYRVDKKRKEKIGEYNRNYRQINKKKYKELNAKWIKENRNYINCKHTIRRAKLKNSIGSFTLQEWESKKKEFNYCCVICKIPEQELLNETGIGLTIDHIIPLNKNGTNWIKNIQPLCKSCNSRKKDKLS
jgi:5-methylcytosine-specific restriction endonuclease McrA